MKKLFAVPAAICALLLLAAGFGHWPVIFFPCSAAIPTKPVLDGFRTALVRYKMDCGAFPTTTQGLNALLYAPEEEPNWKGPYIEIKASALLDPWGRPYHYRSPGVHNRDYDL